MNPKIELLNIDCLEYMKGVPDKYFELAIVDPPYGIEKEISVGGAKSSKSTVNFHNRYKAGSRWDKKPTSEYFKELFRVSENQIICGGNYFPELWTKPVRGFIFWYKETPVPNFSDGELLWTSFQKPAKFFKHRYTNILDGNNQRQDLAHPTAKPISLYKWLLENYATCNKCNNHGCGYEDVVGDGGSRMLVDCEWCEVAEKGRPRILDTHGGSMSIAIACHQMGFDLTLCEIDKDYYDAGVKRFKEQTMQQSLFK